MALQRIHGELTKVGKGGEKGEEGGEFVKGEREREKDRKELKKKKTVLECTGIDRSS